MARRADRARATAAAPSPGGRLSRKTIILLSAAAVAGVLGVVAFITRMPSAPDPARVPSPPDAARQLDAVRQHLRDRYSAAQREPAAGVPAYCLALHADMFYEAAERCYAVVLDSDGGAWPWNYYRALLRSDLGGGDALTRDLQGVVESQPGFAPAWLRLGDAAFKAGDYDGAARAWRRVRELPEPARPDTGAVIHVTEMPAAAYAALGLARIALMRGDRAAARQLLERLIAEAPSFGSAHRLLAELYDADGRDQDARRALARARRLPPFAAYADPLIDTLALESRHSTFLLRLASEANLAVNAAWSEFLTRRALQFDPDNPEVVMKLARVLRTVRRNDEALQYFQRYQQLVPGDVRVLADIGSTLSELGRFQDAEPLLRRAVAALDDATTHYNLGLLLALTGRNAEAIAEYRGALERDPSDLAARGNLAAALVRAGDLTGATRELTRVLELDPENAIAQTNLGLVLLQRGDTAGARRALEEALRLDPSLAQAAEALTSLAPDSDRR